VASDGLFGALFRPDGSKGPFFSYFSASCLGARQKWPLKACLEHCLAQMAPKRKPKIQKNRFWGVWRSGLGRKLAQSGLLEAIWWLSEGLWGSFLGAMGPKGMQREPNGSLRGDQWEPKGSQKGARRGPWAAAGPCRTSYGTLLAESRKNTENLVFCGLRAAHGSQGDGQMGPSWSQSGAFVAAWGALGSTVACLGGLCEP